MGDVAEEFEAKELSLAELLPPNKVFDKVLLVLLFEFWLEVLLIPEAADWSVGEVAEEFEEEAFDIKLLPRVLLTSELVVLLEGDVKLLATVLLASKLVVLLEGEVAEVAEELVSEVFAKLTSEVSLSPTPLVGYEEPNLEVNSEDERLLADAFPFIGVRMLLMAESLLWPP